MKNKRIFYKTNSINSLKDLIVNNPQAKERISIREIEKDIKKNDKQEGKNHATFGKHRFSL